MSVREILEKWEYRTATEIAGEVFVCVGRAYVSIRPNRVVDSVKVATPLVTEAVSQSPIVLLARMSVGTPHPAIDEVLSRWRSSQGSR